MQFLLLQADIYLLLTAQAEKWIFSCVYLESFYHRFQFTALSGVQDCAKPNSSFMKSMEMLFLRVFYLASS